MNTMFGKNVISPGANPFDALRVNFAGNETWSDTAYYLDNHNRWPEHVVIQLTIEGACFLDTQDGRVLVEPGKAFILEVPSQTVYGFPESAACEYRLSFLAASGAASMEFARIFRQRFGSVIDFTQCPESHSLFREIVERYLTNSFRDQFDASSRLYQLFAALFREAEHEAVKDDPVALCYQRIQNRFREPVNISEIAREGGLSREHLARSFRRRYGQIPSVMLRELRLREARLILESGVKDYERIARAIGFNDVRTLRRYLK